MNVQLFVSHSSADKELAKAFVRLLEGAFSNAEDIFCSSVAGYTLGIGDEIVKTLRQNLSDMKLIAGLLTSNALDSPWVHTELSVGWSTNHVRVLPILVGTEISDLTGPLQGHNAVSAADDLAMYQVIEDIGRDTCWKYRPLVISLAILCGTR